MTGPGWWYNYEYYFFSPSDDDDDELLLLLFMVVGGKTIVVPIGNVVVVVDIGGRGSGQGLNPPTNRCKGERRLLLPTTPPLLPLLLL